MENVPKIVRAKLRPMPPAAEPHPDADLLTAFAEQSLSGRERDHVLEHLAQCGDCRDVVALALPATESAALAPSHSPARIGWLSLPILRWGVVAAGVLAITSVGILQYRQRHQEKTLVATSIESRDQLTDTAAQSPAPSPNATSSKAVAPQSEMGKQIVMAKKVPAPSRVQAAPVANQPAPAPNSIFPPAQPMRHSTSAGAFHGATGGLGIGSGAGQSSGAVEVSPQRSVEAPPDDQVQMVGKAKPASPQAHLAMVPAPLLHADPALMKGLAAPRWTISAGGALQRSFDGGKTWLDVDVAANDSASANLAALLQTGMNTVTVEVSGAAPAVRAETQTETKNEAKSETKTAAKTAPRPSAPSNVKSAEVQPAPAPRTIFRAVSVLSNATEVWAGGSGGALYHTLDSGNHWARVIPSDTGAILSGEVIGIQFSNPRNGIVTTSNAEVWTTLDAGQTWHKRQ